MMASSISIGTQPVAVLRNELILKSIFRDVAIRDLKICRLVDSKWNQLALKEIQRQNLNSGHIINGGLFVPYLKFFRDIPENLPYLCHTLQLSYQDFSDPESQRAKLEREYCETFKKQIKGIDIRSRSGVNLEDVLEILGESLVELGVRIGCSEPDYPNQLKFLSNSTDKFSLPNLKSISVGVDAVSSTEILTEDMMSECSLVFKNILSRMRPNSLEELNFHNWERFDLAVEHLIEFNQMKSLKRIALYPNPNFRNGDFLLFRNKRINLQLRQLKVHIINTHFQNNGVTGVLYDLDPEEFCQFLVTQKETLQNINLLFPSTLFLRIWWESKHWRCNIEGKIDHQHIHYTFCRVISELKESFSLEYWTRLPRELGQG